MTVLKSLLGTPKQSEQIPTPYTPSLYPPSSQIQQQQPQVSRPYQKNEGGNFIFCDPEGYLKERFHSLLEFKRE